MTHKRWLPLEANPEVITHFSNVLGLDTSVHSFSDVYGLDPVHLYFHFPTLTILSPQELLAFVPGPVLAILLLFPINEQSKDFKLEGNLRIHQH